MKNLMNKFFAAAALVACIACSKVETDVNKVVNNDEKGVFVTLSQIVEDDAPATRGYATRDWAYNMEEGDRIAIWSTAGSLQIFKVVETQTNEYGNFVAKIEASGFTLTDNEEYYASYPYVAANSEYDFTDQVLTYEGQTQTDQDGTTELRKLGKYDYNWAKATCVDGKTNFSFKRFSTFFRVIATLPREDMTIKEVKVTANQKVFALNGLADMSNGTFTPTGELSESISMTLNNLTVNGKVLTAYFASNPLPAADYVITITDSEGKVYTSQSIHKDERIAGAATKFEVTVAPEGGYVKLTSMPSVLDGKYLLVYPTNGKYRAFSFAKTMENAETAADDVANVSGIVNLYDHADAFYNTVIGGNYVEITDEDGDGILMLTDEQEAELALNMAANSSPWTVTENAKDLQTTLTSGSYSLGVDHLVANVASDGKADLVASFNAPNAVAIMNDLRGHNVNVTFEELIDLAIAKTSGMTSSDAYMLKIAFGKLVTIAKGIVENNPHNLFPAGSSLDNITLSTNAFTEFSKYHDNAADISWRISPEKRFGLAQIGYNTTTQGFTVSVNLPSYTWFNELKNALTAARFDKATFVNYWQRFDDNSQYDVSVDGVKINNFYTKLATRFANSFEDYEFMGICMYANKFAALGNSYKTLAEKLNTGIQPAFIYKKVADAE